MGGMNKAFSEPLRLLKGFLEGLVAEVGEEDLEGGLVGQVLKKLLFLHPGRRIHLCIHSS